MGLPEGGSMFLTQRVQELLSFRRGEADAIFDWHPLQLDVLLKSTSPISFDPQFTTDRVLIGRSRVVHRTAESLH